MVKIKRNIYYHIPEIILKENNLCDYYSGFHFKKIKGFRGNPNTRENIWIKTNFKDKKEKIVLDRFDDLFGFPWYLREAGVESKIVEKKKKEVKKINHKKKIKEAMQLIINYANIDLEGITDKEEEFYQAAKEIYEENDIECLIGSSQQFNTLSPLNIRLTRLSNFEPKKIKECNDE
jgi:hypothetical protein